MPSVIDAAMNRAEASSSFSPVALEKRLLERIQIRRGMLKMRISVMELGRFTAQSGFRRANRNACLIILQRYRERNVRKCRLLWEGARLSSAEVMHARCFAPSEERLRLI